MRLSTEQASHVISLFIDAFKYLHSNNRSHADFHYDNALISEDVYKDGILIIDFGSGHRASDGSPDTPNRGNVNFKPVQSVATFGRRIERNTALQESTESDFVAFGRILALLADCFFGNANYDQKLAYRDFCEELSQGRYHDWDQVLEAFASVHNPAELATVTERLFFRKDGSRRVITIPVSRHVPVGEATLSVINSKEFQRLRFTKQLSFCEWYYPGGVHTRFEHSLGVMELVRRVLGKIVYDPLFRRTFQQRSVDALLLAGLTHDIGHFPFAHVLEHYVESVFAGSNRYEMARSLVDHRIYTLHILKNNDEIKSVVDSHWGPAVLEEAIKIIDRKGGVLTDIIDGPIDCDKLDYIRRDAYHCGVTFGQGVDCDAIIGSFKCVETDDGLALGIASSGTRAVEGFLIAQAQMLGTVYWQEYIRSVIAMFHAFLTVVVGDNIEALAALVKGLKTCINDQQALECVIFPLLSSRSESDKKMLSPLISLHSVPDFSRIYLKLAEYNETEQLPQGVKRTINIYHSIVEQKSTDGSLIPIEWAVVNELKRCFISSLKNVGIAASQVDVLIDVPFGKASSKHIYVASDHSVKPRQITLSSYLKDVVFNRPAAYLSPVRVFVSPEIADHVFKRFKTIREVAEGSFYEREFANKTKDELNSPGLHL